MKKIYLLLSFCFFVLFSNQATASHYLGSEISYTCIGGNQYQVKLRIYNDCVGGSMGSSIVIDAHSSCVANLNMFLNLTTSQAQDVTPSCPTTTTACNGGSGTYGISMYEYTGIVTFVPCTDWVIDYNSCCRNSSATNLNFPTTQGHYVTTFLNNVNQPCNNSPNFVTDPIFMGCAGDTMYQSMNAVDFDGDSLVYSLTNCLTNSATASTTYAPGFSATAPFSGSTSINSQTGLLTINTTIAQSGYICVKVEEFRNGVKIGEVMRDILIKMQNCTNTIPKVHQINGVNIALNSVQNTNVGNPLILNFKIYDVEAQAASQTLSAVLLGNFPTATTSFNATTATFTVIWTPTAADVGTNYLSIAIQDNNCPYLGQSQFTVKVNVSATPFVTAVDDAFWGYTSVPIIGNLLANDLSSNGNLTVLITPIVNVASGSLTITSDGNFHYMNTFGFVGVDYFTYQVCDANMLCDTGSVYLDVQALPTVIANDDYFSTVINEPLIGNVLTNDNANVTVTIINTTLPNGVFSIDPTGDFSYLSMAASPNITDSFTYIICNSNGLVCDTAIVYINILPPTYTVAETIVLGETYPLYYCFSDSASLVGDTLDNAVITFVNDSCFNLFGDNLGIDTVTIISNNEIVNFIITVQNGVWPGDTDDDALVNNVDLLNIGLAYGATGVPRNPQSILWNGYLTTDWGAAFPNGLNAKHADTNGDGIINADDTLAIVQNWGLTYNKNGGRTGASIYLETDSMTIINDSIVYVPIMLGSIQTPVSSIYGMAFRIEYNWELVKDSSVMVHFDPSWLGTANLDIISIHKDFYNDELIEVAVTRIDGNNIGGSGQIGRMCFTIQDDIIRGTDSLFTFNVTNVTAIDKDRTILSIQGDERAIHWESIINIANHTTAIDLSNKIKVYPNPASDYLNIEVNDVLIETVEIYDLTGRKVLVNQNWNNVNRLNINNLSTGMYIVHIKTNLGSINQKLIIEN